MSDILPIDETNSNEDTDIKLSAPSGIYGDPNSKELDTRTSFMESFSRQIDITFHLECKTVAIDAGILDCAGSMTRLSTRPKTTAKDIIEYLDDMGHDDIRFIAHHNHGIHEEAVSTANSSFVKAYGFIKDGIRDYFRELDSCALCSHHIANHRQLSGLGCSGDILNRRVLIDTPEYAISVEFNYVHDIIYRSDVYNLVTKDD